MKLSRLSAMIQSNTKSLSVKLYFSLLKQEKSLRDKKYEVYFYGSHVRQSQSTDPAKVLHYFTNK